MITLQLQLVAHTAITKGARGRQGASPAPVDPEGSAIVALSSPAVGQGRGVVCHGRERGGGGGWGGGGSSRAPTILLVARCTVGREPERAGEGEGLPGAVTRKGASSVRLAVHLGARAEEKGAGEGTSAPWAPASFRLLDGWRGAIASFRLWMAGGGHPPAFAFLRPAHPGQGGACLE